MIQLNLFEKLIVALPTKVLYYHDLGIHYKINIKANNRPFTRIFYRKNPLYPSHYKNDYDNLNKWFIHLKINKRNK